MKIRLTNFAKIKNAYINVDAITVIAGPNDSGKSTIGKSLDAVFTSLSDIKNKMNRGRRLALRNNIANVLNNTGLERLPFGNILSMEEYSRFISQFSEQMTAIQIRDKVESIVDELCNAFFSDYDKKEYLNHRETIIDELSMNIKEVMDVSDEVFEKRIISSQFDEIFNGDINNKQSKLNAEVQIEIKGEKIINIGFVDNRCDLFSTDIDLKNNSYYVENPYLIDRLNMKRYINSFYDSMTPQERKVFRGLEYTNENDAENVLQEIITDNKARELMDVINQAMPGSIRHNKKYEYVVKGKENIDVRSLSTGLKSFAIVKRLLEVGKLNDKDVLILDEPEIHLHPEWQHLYAEMIVLLQKSYNLHILVTTHSSKFLEAIEFKTKKHGLDMRCHYYIADINKDETTTFLDVTNHTEDIYSQMIKPSLKLDKEEYIWEMEHNDE